MIDADYIDRWAGEYSRAYDEEVFTAVRRRVVERGAYDRVDFLTVGRWKARGRTAPMLERNSDDDISEITRCGLAASDAVGYRVLTLLAGVWVPTASALLTVADPDRFTVIDFRALNSLRRHGELSGPDPDYPTYVRLCRRLADRCRRGLRELDRALWEEDRVVTKGAL